MQTSFLEPRKALNKAFLKIKPNRTAIENFKINLISLLSHCEGKESEEHYKIVVIDFLKKTYYDPNHYVNTKGRTDLVIHNGRNASTSAGVIVEAKSPANRQEMISKENLNGKALQEAVLYYMRERITSKNSDLRHIIVTNIYEWFIFDAQNFNKWFADDKSFVSKFNDFEAKRASGHKTDYFYNEIAKPKIASIPTIEYTHFDLREYDTILKNADREDDRQLIALYKLLSPEHLLKLSFANDSNSLDKNFYNELLHIIGLTETKEGGKKIIGRNKPGQRHSGSIIENTILQLESMDKLSRLSNPKQYGDTIDERLFNVALELAITWVNRILFLKLLEAQLIAYQKNKEYGFLNIEKIKDYDNLNTLFFQVLARKPDQRTDDAKRNFSRVPYLNSSLFEMTDLEHAMFPISQLEDNKMLPFLSSTVIKDTFGKRRTGEMNALNYFFEFLDAYDFSSEGTEDIQEDNKTLINASVLGLIFEKINGYKDGSVFTPGFITMYMCRETIRKAVIQKFNEVKGWNCKTFVDLQNQDHLSNLDESNDIINSLRICDPAVGSGHFLVSALNEIIVIKSRLRILRDREGVRLHGYFLEIENDELIVTDDRGNLFQYNPLSPESRRIQETLFHEKQTIIENCLFGVDVNPNSVKICRLRLWIELLKNAYYKGPDYSELETLPNIDINIKAGNSLISRFPLDADLKKALKDSKWNIESYKLAVATYRGAGNKEEKHEMERLIADIKGNFRSEISSKDPKKVRLDKLKGELHVMVTQTDLFGRSKKEEAEWNKRVKAVGSEIAKLERELDEIKNNKVFETAFEWRFEFPEVLDDDGDFVGFDAVIGNPPYIQLQKMGQMSIDLERMRYETFAKTGDIYSLFYELGFRILKTGGILTFITSNKWMRAAYGESLRKYFVEKTNPIQLIDFGGVQVFDTATVDTNILMAEKKSYEGKTYACVLDKNFTAEKMSDYVSQNSSQNRFPGKESWVILSPIEKAIKEKIERIGTPLKDWDIQINYGIKTGFNEAFIITGDKRRELIEADPKSEEIIRPILRGRDIKRYTYEFADLWLIATFPSLKIDIEKYPAVKAHLLSFGYDRLKQTGEPGARKKTNNKWFETQDSISYWEDFYKQKIVWKRVGSILRFSFDESGTMALDSTCFATGCHIKFLVAFLNSRMGHYLLKDAPQTGTGDSLISVQAIEPLRIPIPILSIEETIANIIDQLIENPSKILEKQIDQIIYSLFKLTPEEINFIEKRI